MRSLSAFLTAAVSALAFAQAAAAADLPVKAPLMPAPAPFSWYGFYVGIQGGYAWGGQATKLSPDANYAPAAAAGVFPLSVASDPSGGLGGIQYGSNFQFGRVVLGTASDFSFTDIKASQTAVTAVFGPAVTTSARQKLEWLSTTRVRAGYTVTDNLLLYGTGGLATGRASASGSILQVGCPAGSCVSGSEAKTRWGWSAGGGMEYAMGQWSVNVEYLHYDLGNLHYNLVDPTTPFAFIATSTKFSGDLVRGGINYRFNWTPWELLFGRRS